MKGVRQRQDSAMTAVTFVFLTLFTWIMPSGSWLNLEQGDKFIQTELCEEKHALIASCENFISHECDKTKQIMTYVR